MVFLQLPVSWVRCLVLRVFFVLRLLKSKAQIGVGRYEGFFARGAFLAVFLAGWPFLDFMSVY
ncbi:hypothetical protein PQR33_05180, partial [Paraburkholderia sediminicola]|uniref:hypothetical protein n=1 Tax=Paraburkholderia sediminicola TaxID=458836 RepID=UPI0038BA43F6